MALVLLVAILYNIPRFLERAVIWQIRCTDGLLRPVTKFTSFRQNRIYFLVYKTLCYFVFRAVGPLAALVILNSRLIRALSKVRRRRINMLGKSTAAAAATALKSPKNSKAKAGSATKQHDNLTLMLVTVVTVFIVCQVPAVSIRVAFTASEFSPSSVRLDLTALRYANVLCNALLTLNSAVNFVVYCLVGKKFRRILVEEMFYPCFRRFPLFRLCWSSWAADTQSSGGNDGDCSLDRTAVSFNRQGLPETAAVRSKTRRNYDGEATEEVRLLQMQSTDAISTV